MSTVPVQRSTESIQPEATRNQWLPLALGLSALYVPTIFDLGRNLWNHQEYFHGAIVLVVTIWLLWKERALLNEAPPRSSSVIGWAVFTVGLASYVLGRSQEILLLEVGSALWALSGLCLVSLGRIALRKLWFPILFLGFMVPLPGVLVDTLTGPMKEWVSALVEQALYAAGYPIARTGVILSIGSYQLLIADACSGVNSMFSLGALGTLYVYLIGHVSRWRVAFLVLMITPISFIANLLRVIVLALITFHMGDEAGQGFLHGFSGIVLFVSALCMFLFVDWLLDRLTRGVRPTGS